MKSMISNYSGAVCRSLGEFLAQTRARISEVQPPAAFR